MKNKVAKISDFGQSIWLDYIQRDFILSGALKKMIDEDGLKGVTSNPAIFEEAIAKSNDYNESLSRLAKSNNSAKNIFWSLAIEDVRNAADALSEVYKKTSGLDGYVSLEVSPHLALKIGETIEEARMLWEKINRKNAMIKVPGTKEGLLAINELITEGINVNVTLLFGLERYREVAEAYVDGLERRDFVGRPINHVASVASFFISRIDTCVDPMLEALATTNDAKGTAARNLIGKVAVSCAKEAYQIYKEVFGSKRFKKLQKKGAKPQRLLWASTGTKNKAYSDVMYVDELIGTNTVNTVPVQTLNAYRDHGKPASRLEENIDEARLLLQQLSELGIDLKSVSEKLEEEGIEKFIQPFEHLLEVIEEKMLEEVRV